MFVDVVVDGATCTCKMNILFLSILSWTITATFTQHVYNLSGKPDGGYYLQMFIGVLLLPVDV